jgi:hypothetical protein
MCQCGQVVIWQGTQALSLTEISLRISSEKVPPSTDSGKRLPCQSNQLQFHMIP